MCPLLPSGLADSGSQEEGASLTFTGEHATGEGKGKGAVKCDITQAVIGGLLLLLLPFNSIVTVVIDGYTHKSTLISGDSVSLGTQLILVCQVVGLPYGTSLNYTWTCPNGPCEGKRDLSRKIYNEHILAVNTTSTSDGGTYTCQVTATGGEEARANFTLSVKGTSILHYSRVLQHRAAYWSDSLLHSQHAGGSVVHSYGRLIPHEFPITDLQQISGASMIGKVNCTVSNGTARLISPSGEEADRLTNQTAVLVVNLNTNRDFYCNSNNTNHFYIYITSNNSESKAPAAITF